MPFVDEVLSVFHKFLQHALLVIFAGISLLGSPGIHALMGISHGHSHSVAVHAPSKKPVESQAPHRCKHHHHSENEASDQPAHSHEDQNQPEHECPICEWAAQSIADVSTPHVPLVFERAFLRVQAVDELAPWISLVTQPARGPPSVA